MISKWMIDCKKEKRKYCDSGESRVLWQKSTWMIFVRKWRHLPEMSKCVGFWKRMWGSCVTVNDESYFFKYPWCENLNETRSAAKIRPRRLREDGGRRHLYVYRACMLYETKWKKQTHLKLFKYFHLIHYIYVAFKTTAVWEISWFWSGAHTSPLQCSR